MEREHPCGLLIKQINDELRKNANNGMRDLGMTVTQFGLLVELHRAPEGQRTLKELEQRLHVAQSTVVGIVSRLEQKGLVSGHGDPEDRRVKWVRITEDGQNLIEHASRNRDEAEDRLLSCLTETERDFFLTLLRKVRDNMR